MRFVFTGAGELSLRTAEMLIGRGHEVIIVERNRSIIDELSGSYDCSFLNGDGSNPAVLKEVRPEETDVLFCLTDDDNINLISSLVGRSLGFKKVITKIEDPEFEPICRELNLDNTIIPSRTIGRYLADMAKGVDIIELSTVIKAEARFFDFTVKQKEDAGAVKDLDLPDTARVICLYRDGSFMLADDNTQLRKGDEVVILTHSDNLEALRERWQPKQGEQ